MTTVQKSQDLVEKYDINKQMEVDKKTGVITLADGFYQHTLDVAGVGVTEEQLKKVQRHDAGLIAATTLAAGEKAVELFKDNANLSEIQMQYTCGNNTTQAFFNRGESNTSFTARNVVTVPGVQDKGELGKVHRHLAQTFASLYDTVNS